MAPTATGTPRWPVLASLASGVLAAHLLLLAGGLPFTAGIGSGQETPPDANPAAADAVTAAPGASDLEPPLRVAALTVSAVRWIVPATPVTAPPAPPSPPSVETPPQAAAPGVAEPPAVPLAPAPAKVNDDPTTERLAAAPVPDTTAPTEAATPAPAEEADSDPSPVDDTLIASADTGPNRTAAVTRSLPSAQVPPSTRLAYEIRGKAKGLGYSADAQLQWQIEGSRYTAEMEISAFLLGNRVQSSRGSIGPQGLMPQRFGDRRRGSEKAAHFDHVRQLIRFSNNAPDAALQPGAQDRLSVFLQLGSLLQARPQAYLEGAEIALQVAGTGDAEIWRFEVGQLQTLNLPAGPLAARRLLREPRRDYDSTVEVWLAPSLQHLPVRIRVTEHDGAFADQLLRQLPPSVR